MLQSLEEFLISQAVGFVRIDGETKPKVRDALVTKFQFDNTVSYFFDNLMLLMHYLI